MALELSQHYPELLNKFKASRTWRDNFKKRNGINCLPHEAAIIFHPEVADSNEATSMGTSEATSSPYQHQSLVSHPLLPSIVSHDADLPIQHGSDIPTPTAEEADTAMDVVLRFVRAQTEESFSEHIVKGAETLYRRFGSEFNG